MWRVQTLLLVDATRADHLPWWLSPVWAIVSHALPLPSVQLDSLCPRRDASRQHEARIVGQLLTLMDGAAALNPPQQQQQQQHGHQPQHQTPGHIVVIGASSRPNAIDPALRRPGR